MTEQTLIPPDLGQCQAEKPNGHNFMTLGGRPGLERCTNTPDWIATEKQPGADGLVGSMSLCQECRDRMEVQLGADFCTFEPVHCGD